MKYITYKHITLAARIYLLAVGVFTIFRLLLFITGLSFITSADSLGNVLYAFWMGLRFDLVITGYIVFIPFIALTVIAIFNIRTNLPVKIIFYLLFVVFTLSFTICAMDIPYFGQFFARFNVAAFQWMDTPGFVFKMIIEEIRYIGYAVPFVLLTVAFFFGLKKSFSAFIRASHQGNIGVSITLSLCVALLMFVGIRGRVEKKSPITIGTAFFGSNSFLNHLGLNPNFSFIRSWLDYNDDVLQLMDNEEALQQVQTFFGIDVPDTVSPILRRVNPDSVNSAPANVVLILMESMSAANMQYFGNQQQLTPFLDSIATKGYFFENIYSTGIHTHNGVFGTLFSFPALYHQLPMRDVTMPKYNGNMSSTLKKNGYNTLYFTTYDGQFDNIEGFLLGNNFDKVITQSDYPSDKIGTKSMGVPDDYMFEFSIPVLTQHYNEQRPFFAVFSTSSNHGPYYIPAYFSPRQQNIALQATEYSDWSLRKFLSMAEQQPWFANTLFIFIADHGWPTDVTYDMSLSYNHVPLIMYASDLIPQARVWDGLGGQIDVFPTAMNLLGLPYTNNTLGIDLLSESRPFMYFSATTRYGVVSDSLFLIVTQNDGTEGLFRYRHRDKTNYIDQYRVIADEMKNYAAANMQTAQYMTSQRKQAEE